VSSLGTGTGQYTGTGTGANRYRDWHFCRHWVSSTGTGPDTTTALVLAQRDTETGTSEGTRLRRWALGLTLLQALVLTYLKALGLTNIQALGLA
jgi:hypothetical protein